MSLECRAEIMEDSTEAIERLSRIHQSGIEPISELAIIEIEEFRLQPGVHEMIWLTAFEHKVERSSLRRRWKHDGPGHCRACQGDLAAKHSEEHSYRGYKRVRAHDCPYRDGRQAIPATHRIERIRGRNRGKLDPGNRRT